MANALREVLAEFGVSFDDTELKKGDAAVSGVKNKLTAFGAVLKGLPIAAGIAAIGKMVASTADEADALAKASIGLGLHARELQELEHAAGLSGVGVDTLRGALARLQKGAAEAAEKGSGPVADAFKKLGVPLKDASGNVKTTGALFTDAAGAIASIQNPTERAGAAAALFGKNYAPLLPLILEGKDGIKALRGEVEELGFGFDDAFLEDAQEMNDNLERLHKGVRGFAVRIAALVLPALAKFSGHAVNIAKRVIAWTQRSNILKSALIVLGAAGLRPLLGLLRTMIPLLWRLLAPMLPWIALAVGAAFALDELITTFKGGDTLIRRFIDSMFGVGTTDRVVKELSAIWQDFTNVVLPEAIGTIKEVGGIIISAIGDALSWVGARFDEFLGLAHSVWEALPAPLQEALDAITGAFGAAFDWIGNKISSLIEQFFPLKELFNTLDSNANADAKARREAADRDEAAGAKKPGTRATPAIATMARGLDRTVGTAGAPRGATATAPPAAGTSMQNTNNFNVTVPPGTPKTLAERTANATARATRSANKVAFKALVHRAP